MKKLVLFLFVIILLPNLLLPSEINVVRPHVDNSKYPGAIDEMKALIIPQGTYAEVNLELTFSSKGSNVPDSKDTLEIEFNFEMNPNAFISDAWLNLDGVWIQADIMDLWTASHIYEEVVHRIRRDPLLLKKLSPTKYQLRVFPLTRDTSRTIRFTYYTPINFSRDENAYVQLPFEFLKKSTHPTHINIQFLDNSDFENSSLFEAKEGTYNAKENLNFEDIQIADYNGKETFLTFDQINDSVFVKYNTPCKNGAFASSVTDEEEKYFQVVLKPLEDVKPLVPKKVCFLLDYNPNKCNFSKNDLINGLKAALLKNFEPSDKFQVFIADDDLIQYSNNWVDATLENIEKFSNDMYSCNLDTILDKTRLFDMLKGSIDFINIDQDTAIINIISSTDDDGSKERANEILYYVKGKINKHTRIFVSAFVQKNWQRYNIGQLGYAANDYLYRNITQLTGGIFHKIQDNSNDLKTLIQNTVKIYLQSVDELNISLDFDNGFGYSSYYSAELNNLAESKDYIIGIGKYIGDFPLKISVNGFYREKPFYSNYTVSKEDASSEEYDSKLIWTAKKIKELESLPGKSNIIMHDIIMASIYNRILSIYTAFIAIDPNLKDTTNHENEEGEEEDPNDVEDELSLNMQENISLHVYPNPFTETVTISIINSFNNLDNIIESITVYDINGLKVADLTDLASKQNNQFTVSWNGIDQNGNFVPNGMYFIVIKTKNNKYISKVILQR